MATLIWYLCCLRAGCIMTAMTPEESHSPLVSTNPTFEVAEQTSWRHL